MTTDPFYIAETKLLQLTNQDPLDYDQIKKCLVQMKKINQFNQNQKRNKISAQEMDRRNQLVHEQNNKYRAFYDNDEFELKADTDSISLDIYGEEQVSEEQVSEEQANEEEVNQEPNSRPDWYQNNKFCLLWTSILVLSIMNIALFIVCSS